MLRRSFASVPIAALAALGLLSGTATAATQEAVVTLPAGGVTPDAGGGFGVYNFSVAHAGPNAFPFATGDKRGHCVEATVAAGSGPATLKSDGEALAADSPTENNRLAWLMLSSTYNQDTSGASGLTLAQRAAAHQSATWQITDPGLAQTISSDPAVAAEAARLVTASAGNQAAAQQSAAMVALAAAAPCGAGTRGIQVSGAPFSSADLTIGSVNGTFTGGGKTTTLDLGSNGTATAEVTGDVGTVTISGTVSQSKLVHVDFGETQDFAYAQPTPVAMQLAIDFLPCTTGSTPTAPAAPSAPVGATGRNIASLRVIKRGPRRARAGRKALFTITVKNTSRTIARNVVLTDRLPGGMVLAKRTAGMRLRGRAVSMRVGSLGPGRSTTRRVPVSILRQTQGRRCNRVRVTSSNARPRGARSCVTVRRVIRRVSPAVTG